MHKKVSFRVAQKWAKVRKAVWARRRAQEVASWDGSDFEWVASFIEDEWKARWEARAAR